MTLVKSFSYLNINQRRLLLINLFLASLLASSILADIFYSAQYYFFYITSARYILLAVLPALVAGSLLGRFIFSVFKSYRLLFTLIDIFFFIICGLYVCRFFIVSGGANPVFVLITSCGHGMLLYAALISFFAGIKLNYGLKISSGDFIDEKHGIYSFFTICFAGILSGIIIASIHITGFISADNIIIICLQSAAALVVLVSSFFINMEYNPDTMYMHRFDEDEQAAAVEHRDDIFFTYLNASYIFMYTYLAYFNYIKFYADLRWGGARFAAVCILFIMAGFFLGRLVRQSFWHIYSEMLFPVFFMLYVFLIYRFHEQVTPFQALSFIIPAALLFGFTVCQTVRMLVDRFEQESRYNVLFFSMFIIPPPLLIVLSFVEFTYFWYFILIYLLTLLNILIPGLYLLNKNTRTYKKGLYFGLTLVFIPILLFMHLYLKIPINSARYLPKVKNFNELKNTNFNALYLKNKSDIMINDTIAFRSSDSVVRGLKRAMLAALLYQQDDSTALILDGNQKFFRNPVISWFKNYELVDTVPARFVDYERLPLAGNQLYVADEKNIIDALRGEKKYGLIASSPNILDMRHNAFRFSSDYYKYVKEHLTDNGIFAEIINPDFCSKKTISRCVTNISSIYKNRVVYFFS
ncbi:MAG: hypothetical protein LBT84_02775, partial [Spirochaetia bacterium]|nr:hypothetical protein [Spirochaetia bacterium]